LARDVEEIEDRDVSVSQCGENPGNMLSSILDFFRAVDPYLYKLLGKDMYVALDGAPTSCYVTAGIALSAAVVIAFQAKKRLEPSTNAATTPTAAGSTNRGRENSPSVRRALITDGDVQEQDESEDPDITSQETEATDTNSFIFENCSQYSDDFSDVDEGGPPNPGRGNMIRRIKIARQKAINKRIEETLTKADLVKEKMIEAQQMAKIYSLLKQNDSNMTIDDIRGQMSMYKTSYGDVGRDEDD